MENLSNWHISREAIGLQESVGIILGYGRLARKNEVDFVVLSKGCKNSVEADRQQWVEEEVKLVVIAMIASDVSSRGCSYVQKNPPALIIVSGLHGSRVQYVG